MNLKTNKLYKYINLLFRIVIGVAALWFIYIKLEDNFVNHFQEIKSLDIGYSFILIAILLVAINWGVEVVKWKYAIRKVEKISLKLAYKITVTGITLGIITPNRIGEIPARALLLNKDSFKEIILKTTVSSFSQLIITLFLGGVAFLLTHHQFDLMINPVLMNLGLLFSFLILLLLYFKVSRLEIVFNRLKYFREKEFFKALSEFSYNELFNLLILSFVRYIIFLVQFWLLLKAFGIVLVSLEEILLIPICFMIASFIPTILVSEIGVRGSVALLVFGVISDMNIAIVSASFLLWVINIALPALIGLFNLKEIKIVKEK